MSTKAQFHPRLVRHPPFSVEAPGYEPVKGETIPRRNARARDQLVSRPEEGVATIYDLIKRSAEKFGNAKAIGSRKIIKTHKEKKNIKKMVDGKEQEVEKEWSYFELSGYEYKSFIEYEKLTAQIGSGFRKLGLSSTQDKVQIFAATSAQWLATAHGSVTQSIPIVTAYDTLGEEGLTHSLIETNATAIFLDPHLLPKLINPLKEAKDVKYVIYNSDGDVKQGDIDKLKQEHDYLTVLSFEELRQLGESNPVDPVPPQPEDLCCVMYTSGSTGKPKGVPLKHRNVIAAIAGVNVIVGPHIGPGDALLTYLPLAHILEFVFENSCLYWGGVMGYGNPRTLTDASVRNCKGDIREFRPTILVGVPAVWESVKKGVIAKVNQGSAITKNLFWGALAAKGFLMSTGLPGSGILDTVVFKKVKEATGGRLRICLSGGGPIARDTQRFISMAISPLIIGYGLTETNAMGALMDPLAWSDNALGEPPACVEVKLVDFPDAGYFATNNPPQGEIWIRGPSVTEGYVNNPKETEDSITSDGWFKTGDIGEFDHNGHLRIVDRKKNLVKTLNGEYIALEKLESLYRANSVVANICVYAAQDKSKPIAIIVPNEAALKSIASDHGIQGHGLEDLSHNEKLQGIVLKELQAAGRKGGLSGIEIIDGVVLVDEEWTPQNNLVTSAQKLNRRGILDRYKKLIDQAYAKAGQ
ncbi:acetyl-CoA synthetase-like protein [Xylona heveae TC161]|uniref:Acetyl-CoA synthetase-like protein n=1 Tax=Xylona heveae (strain CBS 132557 / TC161) TaxID=1328760 RepID=A0A165IUJ8_XYLHT|nr:acetyl-CoA synthetase-like protein [Xylona heveae TC161]KZF25410.1 acetyl-CoA synthetase-like protein [Xylona heveae TC161]